MKKVIVISIVSFLILPIIWGESVLAAGKGTSGAVVLAYPVGARAIGMGEGFTAVADDGSAAYWNPAGLTYLTKKELLLFYLEGIADTNYGFIGFASPGKIGTLGVSIASLQAGKAEIYNSTQLTKEVIAQSDYVGTISYARKLARVLSIGVNIKAWQSELAEQEKANAYAVDAGLLYETPLPNLFLGLVGQNMGSKIKYITQEDPLPTTGKVGLAYTIFSQTISETETVTHAFTIAADEEKPNDDKARTNIGLEYSYAESFFLRGGYKLGRDTENFSVGVGFNYSGVELDYAYAPMQDLESNHRMSLLIRF